MSNCVPLSDGRYIPLRAKSGLGWWFQVLLYPNFRHRLDCVIFHLFTKELMQAKPRNLSFPFHHDFLPHPGGPNSTALGHCGWRTKLAAGCHDEPASLGTSCRWGCSSPCVPCLPKAPWHTLQECLAVDSVPCTFTHIHQQHWSRGWVGLLKWCPFPRHLPLFISINQFLNIFLSIRLILMYVFVSTLLKLIS